MLLSTIEKLRQEDLKFSAREIEKGSLLMVFAALAVTLLAFLTFEGEYLSGYAVEQLLEFSGLVKQNWIADHQDVFLHDIQLLFVVSFLVEIILLIGWYIKGWEL